jgi:hypothetical protein
MARRRNRGLPPVSEDAFLRLVLDYARLRGWRVAHFRPARTARGWRTAVQGDGAGFPDLVLVRLDGDRLRVIFAELKTERSQIDDNQQTWADLLSHAKGDVEYYLWRPSKWKEIEEALALRQQPRA